MAQVIFENRDLGVRDLSTPDACAIKLRLLLDTRPSVYPPWHRFDAIFETTGSVSEEECDKCLFVAAICTNTLPIVQDLVKKHKPLLFPSEDSRNDVLVFREFEALVSMYGNKEVLEWLLTTGVTIVNKYLRSTLFSLAVRARRADIAQFLYDFRRKEVSWDLDNWSAPDARMIEMSQYTTNLQVQLIVEGIYAQHPCLRPKHSTPSILHLIDCAARGIWTSFHT